MHRLSRRRALVGGLGACALLTSAEKAHAIDCSALSPSGTTIYGAGGSSQEPIVAQIAAQLANQSPPTWLVYNDTGSACVGYQDLVGQTTISSGLYWDTAAKKLTSCALASPQTTTFAIMGNSPAQCPQTTGLAPGIGQFLGSVQSIDFVVPSQSTQESISTEAAYYIWGFGGVSNKVDPWNTPANIFTRSSSSFLTIFVGLDTGLSAARIAQPYAAVGDAAPPPNPTQVKTNQLTVSGLAALVSSNPNSGIGFVSGEVADAERGNNTIKVLAYQHTGQSCGYWPDSNKDALDKINVRTGQYWLWSPVHFFAAVNTEAGTPKVADIADEPTRNLIGWFTGDITPPAGIDIFGAEIASGTVPKCAMQAWRDGDLGTPYSYAPPASCSCKFDIATHSALKPASCQTCSTDSDCTVTHHCRNTAAAPGADAGANPAGYCEVN
jgi:ABC-type phosphate transport system substrate-binding protein